jgi:dihydrofolate synthase / folylpolyglutamate synthase
VFDLPKYGDGVCLARLAELLDALSVDRARLQRISVVVTGSNGKGSTAAFCAGIGKAHGLRTGLFTSPHLYRFNERIRIDGAEIGDDDLARLKSRIESAVAAITRRSGEQFGAFEALFALACLHFGESGCEFAVFEAGIGGRYDPVRLAGARVTCVTSIDYEHVELLGDSLELIASDKSDACASGGTIIYGENCASLRPHLIEYNRSRAITSLFVRDQIEISGESVSAPGQRFDFEFGGHAFRSLEMRLLGSFQFNNASIAVTLFLLWLQRARPGEDTGRIEASVRSGLREVSWPGRLEEIQQDPLTVIDVGHTPDGIKQSLASLKAIYGADGWILVTGASRDKNTDEIVRALAPSFDTMICTRAHHKGAEAEAIAAAARMANPAATVQIAATIEDAVGVSRSLAGSMQRKIYVAGGLFLAIEYAVVVRGARAEEMRFF